MIHEFDISVQFLKAIESDNTFGRAYTHLAHTLLLLQESQSATVLLKIVDYLEKALVYDRSETRENQVSRLESCLSCT